MALKESPNTLQSNSIAKIKDLLGEGVIKGLVNGAQSIILDGTPLESSDGSKNFKGFKWDIRYGYPDQEPIAGDDGVTNEVDVGTSLTRQLGSIVRQLDNPDLDACRVKITLPNLSMQDTKTGDLKPNTVQLRIEVQPNGGEYRDVVLQSEELDRTGATTTGAFSIGFTATITKQVLCKLNQAAEATLELQYRQVGTTAWTSLGERIVSQVLTTVDNPNAPDGSLDGQPAYYVNLTATYELVDIGANNYEIQMVEGKGDSITNFATYQKAPLDITGKNTSPTQLSYRFGLPGNAPWNLRVTRITEDSDKVANQNSTTWAGYTEIVEEKLIYPDSAYISSQINAQLFGGRIPSRAFDVYGRIINVPSNYNPETRTYDGLWDGSFRQAWSDNAAWCFLDMLVHPRYGLGHRLNIDQIDTTKIYEIAQYCDELVPDGKGGTEPRFTCNACINTQQEAYTLLNTMANVFRGVIYWSSGTVGLSYDAPREIDVLVARANTINDFKYQSSSEKQRHNSVLVTWNDPADNYKAGIEVVDDNEDISRRGLYQTDVFAFGCTSRGQAHRVGRWLLYTERYEKETVTYRCSLDHIRAVPGMIAGICDPRKAGAQIAGRTKNIVGSTVTLDREITLTSNVQYELACVDTDGNIQYRPILTSAGTYAVLELSAAFDPVPMIGQVWGLFGSDVTPRPFRIIGLVEPAENVFEISGLEYNASKSNFVDFDYPLEPINYTRIKTGMIRKPVNVQISETLFKVNNQLKTRATISWESASDNRVYLYRVTWRASTGGIMQEKYTSDLSIEIVDIEPDLYDFFVYAVALGGESQPTAELEFPILGKTARPGDVVNETLTQERKVNGCILSWQPVTDLDVIGYEVRIGENGWDDGEFVAMVQGTTVFIALDDASTHTLMVKAVDELQLYSVGTASIQSAVIPPLVPDIFTAVAQGDQVLFRWKRVAGIDNTYEVRRGASWETAEQIATGSGNEMLILDPQRDTAIYWIKARSTAGLYSEESRAASVFRDLLADRNIILEYDNAADDYVGFTLGMEVDGGQLLLEEISSGVYQVRGEHYFEVDLGAEIKARNWIETTIVSFTGGGATWEEMTFTWNDPQANVSWTPSGDLEGATLTKVIARMREPLDLELYAWGMRDSTTDFRGVLSLMEDNIVYTPVLFGNALQVHDLTRLVYEIELDDTFTLMLKLKTDGTLDARRIIAVLKNSTEGNWLELGYNEAVNSFYLLDELGNTMLLPLDANTVGEDYLCLAITQDMVTRGLYYKSYVAYTSYYETDAIPAAANPYDRLYLYDEKSSVHLVGDPYGGTLVDPDGNEIAEPGI